MNEQKIIIDILSEDKILNKDIFGKIDYSILTKIISSHLFIPTFYSLLNKKKYIEYVPKNFKKFIKKIYAINKNRNKILKEEVLFLSDVLKKARIKHVFIKGASNIFANIYNDYGERMVGDIDFLIDKSDSEKVLSLLNSKGYFSKIAIKSNYKFRHLPRMTNSKKTFAIEPHTNIIDNPKDVISTKNILKNKIKINDIWMPCYEDKFYINILNKTINDNARHMLSYDFRNIYDYMVLNKKIKGKIDFRKDTVLNYIKILAELGIYKDKSGKTRFGFFDKFRFRMKESVFLFRKIDNTIVIYFLRIKKLLSKFKKLFRVK